MCTLVAIAFSHTFMQGFHKVCYYDCGKKRYQYYDIIYRIDPDYPCAARLEDT